MMQPRTTQRWSWPDAMKIFYFVDTFNFGGTESQMTGVVLRLAKRHEVTVGCLKAEGRFLDLLHESGIPVVEFPTGRGLLSFQGVKQLFRLRGFLSSGKFEVLHAQDPWTNLLGVPAARLAGVPVIITSRLDLANWGWYKSRKRVVMRWVQRAGSAIFANSDAVKQNLVANDDFRPDFIRVILNGVDVDNFSGANADREVTLPQAAATDKLVVMVANMHFELKGHDLLIAAAGEILGRHPQTRFVLVGDGERRQLLEKEVRDRGLEKNFFFLGNRRDVAPIHACCDVGILPSRSEGLPNAVLEYMAAGLPVVATRVGGIPEIIEHNVNGILIPSGDARALAESIDYLLSNPDAARKLGAAGQERARTRFSFDQLVSELERLYEGKPSQFEQTAAIQVMSDSI